MAVVLQKPAYTLPTGKIYKKNGSLKLWIFKEEMQYGDATIRSGLNRCNDTEIHYSLVKIEREIVMLFCISVEMQ